MGSISQRIIFEGDPLKIPVSAKWAAPKSIAEATHYTPGEGYHDTFAPWICPESFRLHQLGLKKQTENGFDYEGGLHYFTFGTLWHRMHQANALGHDPIEMLRRVADIPADGREKLETLFLAYQLRYAKNSWWTFGAEAMIKVPVPGLSRIRRLSPITGKWRYIRPHFTVRYDRLVMADGQICNVEHKTTSRFSASSTLAEWRLHPQLVSQQWAASKHPALSKLYATIMDFAVKTREPDFFREPIIATKLQKENFEHDLRAWTILREQLETDLGYDSPWPRTWACTNRYSVCQFVDYCHHGAVELYERRLE